QAPGVRHVTFADGEDPAHAAARALAPVVPGGAAVGVELRGAFLPPAVLDGLRAALPELTFPDCTGLLSAARAVKSAAEVEWTRRAAAVSDAAMRAGIAAARPGAAERVLAELEAAEAALAGLAGAVQGTVQLAAFPTAAAAFVPPAIARCRAEHPDLRVVLTELETEEAVAAVRSGRIDLAIVYEYALLPRVADAGVAVERLFTEPLLAALPAGRAAPDPLPLEDLRDDSWIAPHSDTGLRGVLDRACGLAGFAQTVDYASDDYTVIVALVAA